MAARLLLVHSPLVGCATWDLVAADLAGGGYELGVPDLTGTVMAGPPYWLRQAQVIARSASGQPAILIGHSGAGPLLAAAGAIIGQVRGYIFVDAGLPTPGQAWMETEALAELVPDPAVRQDFAAGCPPLPLAMFEEIHPPAPQWPDAPAAYLQLSEAYEDQAAKARELGWPVIEQMSHHLALLTEPGRVAGSLRELIAQLRQ